MKIQCPITHEIMDKEDCFTCALDHVLPPCGFSFGLLSKIYEGSDRSGVHVTDITGCLRRAYYNKLAPAPIAPNNHLILTLGTVAHALFEKNDNFLKSEIEVEGLGIVGRLDVLQRTTVIDYKTTRWMNPSRLPYGSHGLQVNIYGLLLRKMGHEVDQLAIQYIDMSGPTKCRSCKVSVINNNGTYECPKCMKVFPDGHLGALLIDIQLMDDEYLEEYIIERGAILRKGMAEKIVPDAEPSFLCNYCDHRDKCPEALR